MKKLILASFLALASCAGTTPITVTKYVTPPKIVLPPAPPLNLQTEQFYVVLTSPTDTSAYNFTNQVKAMGNPESIVAMPMETGGISDYLDDQYQLIGYIQQLQAQISAYNFYLQQLNAEITTPVTGAK